MQPAQPLSASAYVRIWLPYPLADRRGRAYRVTFRLAEEATWDHCFHELDGRLIDVADLDLAPADHAHIQECCDASVGKSFVVATVPPGAAGFALAGMFAT